MGEGRDVNGIWGTSGMSVGSPLRDSSVWIVHKMDGLHGVCTTLQLGAERVRPKGQHLKAIARLTELVRLLKYECGRISESHCGSEGETRSEQSAMPCVWQPLHPCFCRQIKQVMSANEYGSFSVADIASRNKIASLKCHMPIDRTVLDMCDDDWRQRLQQTSVSANVPLVAKTSARTKRIFL